MARGTTERVPSSVGRATDFVAAVDALREHGWASIAFDDELHRSFAHLAAAAHEFFDGSDTLKAPYDIRQSIGHRGWVSADEAGSYSDEGARRYEAFDVGREPCDGDRQRHPLRGRNRWPSSGLEYFATSVYDSLATLSDLLCDAVCDQFGIDPVNLHALRTEPVSQLRVIRYLAPADGDVIDLREAHEPAAAMGAHTDYELLTLLYQTQPGTQVLTDAGWHTTPIEGLTVLAGDMLEVVTDGAIQSIMHRAAPHVLPGRISIPFFAGVDFEAVVHPLDGGSSAPVHFGSHLMRQLRRDFPYLRKGAAPVDAIDAQSSFERKALLQQLSPVTV